MSRYTRTQADVVDAIRVEFDTPRDKLRAFDKRVMVSRDWNRFDQWIMLPSGEHEFCFGDWIVRNEAGRLFFCDAETFAADYTPYESHRLVDSDAYYVAPAADLTPYITAMRKQAAELASVTVTPFDIRKDIYLGGTV